MSENERLCSTEMELEHLMRLGYEDMAGENLREAEEVIYAQAEVVMRD